MVLFHLSFVAPAAATNKFRVEIPHDIPMQPMRYVRSVVRLSYSSVSPLTNSVMYARLPFASGYELTNNTGHDLLPIVIQPVPANPSAESQTFTSTEYNITFKASDCPRSFDVEFFQDDGTTAQEFRQGFGNKIQSVDLYFEYAHSDTFH